MAKAEIKIDQAALLAQAAPPAGPIYLFFMRIGMEIDAAAKRLMSNDLVNVRTGNLRSSQQPPVVTVTGGKIELVIQNTASYALAVHNGTKPHTINPRNKQVLTGWSYNGAPVFARIVHHPGTKARPFITDAVREVVARNR